LNAPFFFGGIGLLLLLDVGLVELDPLGSDLLGLNLGQIALGKVGTVMAEATVTVVDGEEGISFDPTERMSYGVGVLVGLVGICRRTNIDR
jgi:hypothetical protein